MDYTIYDFPDTHMQLREKDFEALKGLPKLTETNNVKEAMMLLPKKERERLHYLAP